MQFSEKLSFLMDITSVRNAELSRALHIDPGQISRLRSGMRGAPKKPENVRELADFFAGRCREEYRRTALAEAMGRPASRLASEKDGVAEAIFKWLREDEDDFSQEDGQFIKALENARIVVKVSGEARETSDSYTKSDPRMIGSDNRLLVYSKNEGKQRAMLDLLDELLELDNPGTLMVSSDENCDWLWNDNEYCQKIASMLLELAKRGLIIYRIIPPIRDINDAFNSFSMWLPLYLTGNVKPYYLPKIRDGVYRRTFILAPGRKALISTCVGWNEQSGVTFVYTDPDIVSGYVRDYEMFRDMCLPALSMFDPSSPGQAKALSERMRVYYDSPSPSIRKSNSLSFLSIPREKKRILKARSNSSIMKLLCSHVGSGVMPPESILFDRSITDIMVLTPVEDIMAGKARYCLDDDAVYTPSEYRKHLQGIVRLMERHEEYQVMLIAQKGKNYSIYAKENVGALLFLGEKPYTVVDLMAPTAPAAMWDYLSSISQTGYPYSIYRQRVISTIRRHIYKLPRDSSDGDI